MEKMENTTTSTDEEPDVMGNGDSPEFDTDVVGKKGDSVDELDVMGERDKTHEHKHDHHSGEAHGH